MANTCPEDLSPGDLYFENSGSKKPWRYPGFDAHISSGLRLWFNDFVRVFRLDDADALVEAAAQPPQPTDQEATSGQKYLPPADGDPEGFASKEALVARGGLFSSHCSAWTYRKRTPRMSSAEGSADSPQKAFRPIPKTFYAREATSAQQVPCYQAAHGSIPGKS